MTEEASAFKKKALREEGGTVEGMETRRSEEMRPYWLQGVPVHSGEKKGVQYWATGDEGYQKALLRTGTGSLIAGAVGYYSVAAGHAYTSDAIFYTCLAVFILTAGNIVWRALSQVRLSGNVVRYWDSNGSDKRRGTAKVRWLDLAEVVEVRATGLAPDPWEKKWPDRLLGRIEFVLRDGRVVPVTYTWTMPAVRTFAVAILLELRRRGVPLYVPEEVFTALVKKHGPGRGR